MLYLFFGDAELKIPEVFWILGTKQESGSDFLFFKIYSNYSLPGEKLFNGWSRSVEVL